MSVNPAQALAIKVPECLRESTPTPIPDMSLRSKAHDIPCRRCIVENKPKTAQGGDTFVTGLVTQQSDLWPLNLLHLQSATTGSDIEATGLKRQTRSSEKKTWFPRASTCLLRSGLLPVFLLPSPCVRRATAPRGSVCHSPDGAMFRGSGSS